MKNKRNNKGFVGLELITIIVVCLILACILAIISYQSGNKEKFHVLKYNAKTFALNASNYQQENSKDMIYLQELIDESILKEIKSPFTGTTKCDPYESKVIINDSKKYVTLKCGSYLIDNEYIGDATYKIYTVSDWSLKIKTGKNTEQKDLYNYIKDGKDAYSNNYEENLFLYLFNKDYNTNYTKASDIPPEYGVYSSPYYRTKKLEIAKQK